MLQTTDSVVREHPFFRGMSDQQLKTIEGCTKIVEFVPNQTIFVEGDPADAFYFIQEGAVSIELTMPNHRSSPVQQIRPGEILGWSWIARPYHWHFNARALTATKAVEVNARSLRAKLEEDRELGYELLRRFAEVIVKRLDATQVRLLKLEKEN
jgi:CRP/FNR family cyclic AMP-dependent transcriptional regulator